MSSLCVIRGAFRRRVLPSSHRIFYRTNFIGRPARGEPTSLLPSTPARTRFAPSPTGYLHIGSLRTALFNYLLARATGGQFLLRLEDTDQKRLVPDAEKKLYEDLKWAGLDWDEGPDIGGPYGPYKQSERLQTYREHADKLLEDGKAYRCFCSPEELDAMKKLALDESRDPVYNKTCSHITAEESAQRAADGEAHCIRFKSSKEAPLVQDLVYGTYKSPVPLDDFIIIKRDGFPTYHFANVVDDYLMKITHVIRGAEWLISTPRHVALYNAFKWDRPQFAHVGLLVDQNRQKLSKRDGSFNLSAWKEQGILPIALLNYVLLLGWSPSRDGGEKSEIMTMEDMIRKFHLRFTKGDVTVNSKNEFFQKAHMHRSLSGSGDGKEAAITSILPSLSNYIERCEGTRMSQEDSSAVHPDLGRRIGPLIGPSRSTKSGSVVSQKYLKALFALDGRSYTNPMGFLRRNVYLLWDIPEQAHRESLEEQQQAILSNAVVRTEFGENPQQEPRELSDIATRLLEYLQSIPEEDWIVSNIKRLIAPFTKSIGYSSDKAPFQSWGWPFLRWAINASEPGPGVIYIMVLLGRQETLARMSQATRVVQDMVVTGKAKANT